MSAGLTQTSLTICLVHRATFTAAVAHYCDWVTYLNTTHFDMSKVTPCSPQHVWAIWYDPGRDSR